MPNPFENLGKPKEIEYDEWSGQFSCQTKGCYEVAYIAKYLKKDKILTWICSEKHISKIEDMDE